MRGGLQVHLWFDRDGIGKGNVSALQAELDAVEGGITLQNVGASQNAGTGERAAEPQVGIARKPRHCRLHLKLGRGADGNIQLDVIERRICRRDRRRLTASLEVRSEIKSRGYGELRDQNVSRNH